ncbi:MAG: CapA family protein [Oscillospiraceae bacterium]|nr:CapA family protein [Oscillospiraceae bacterium]
MNKWLRKAAAAAIVVNMLLQCTGCTWAEVSETVTNTVNPVVNQAMDAVFEDVAPTAETGTGLVTLATEQTVLTTVSTSAVPEDISVNVLAVGDNLVQTHVYLTAQEKAGGGENAYDFAPLYEQIKPIVQAADIAIINQETLISGDDQRFGVSGSNFNFNSPTVLGQAMVDVGFDIFTLANNHMLDKGVDGLASSLEYWDKMMEENPILAVGAYKDEADQEKIRIQQANGLKIAYLSYTEHMNGYQLPDGTDIRIGLTSDEELIERQIKKAKELADAVIVSAHWGWEDTHTVSPEVEALAEKMVYWGADVILGTHSHTAETMGYITREDGTKGFVFYSLGNFISAQTDNFNVVGEMGSFNLVKNGETGEVTVEDVQCMPVITQYDSGAFSDLRLIPYKDYTAELANQHGLPVAPMGTAKAFNMDVVNNIIHSNIPEEYLKLD